MAKIGIGLLDQGLEALEEGGKQLVQSTMQQAGIAGTSVVTQVTGTDFSTKSHELPSRDHVSNTVTSSESNMQLQQAQETQDMWKSALYGPTHPDASGQSSLSAEQLEQQAKMSESAELEKTRKQIDQQKMQSHQQQHNDVYFNALNNPKQKEDQSASKQEELEKQKAEDERKKQMDVEEKQKKDEKVKAPSKHESAERERKLGG